MSLFYGLAAALCWGLAQFLTRHATRRLGWVKALVGIQLAGLVTIGALVLWQGVLPTAGPHAWLGIVGLGLCNATGALLLYQAFEIGNLSIVAPVAAGYAVVTAVLSLVHGERFAAATLGGAALMIAGVMVIAFSQNADVDHADIETSGPQGTTGRVSAWAGVPQALGSAFCFGVAFWGLGFVTPALGGSWALLVFRSLAFAGALLGMGCRLTRAETVPLSAVSHDEIAVCGSVTAAALEVAPANALRYRLCSAALVVGVMMTDTVGWLTFNVGIGGDRTAIVTALASLSSAVTVLLACVFLRERLAPAQWAGVGVILMGVLLVSLP